MKNKYRIPLSKPDITKKEKKAVLEVLKTSYLSLGPKLREFEEKIAKYIGVKYAIGVNSGTSSLHLIIRALGIKDNDEVITTPFSFISSANCILYERAKPVFVDINEKTLNIDVNKIEGKITKKTKAILAVDVFSHSANWEILEKIAKKHKLFLIEDSAEALGSEYKGRKCGNFGNAAILSFYPNKQITTGEGGMVLTNNKRIADLCRSMANQGRENKSGKWLEHIRLGYNYRMSEVCATIGVVQLERIKEILKKRTKIAFLYSKKLKDFKEIDLPDTSGGWFVYVVRLKRKYSQKNRDKIIKEMQKKGIQCSNYFYPIHLQPYYKKIFSFKKGDFPICEGISERTIALPFYNNLTEKEIDFVVKNLKEAVNNIKPR